MTSNPPNNPDIPFESMVDLLPEIIYANRPDGYTEYSNARWYEYTGMSREETIGFGWLKALHPDDLARAKQLLDTGSTTGSIPDLEYRFRGADGIYRWFLRRAVARRDSENRIIGWYGICLEIDQRKRRELALQLVDELTDRFRTIADPDEVLWQAVTAVGDHLQVSRVAYGEIDLEKRELKIERDYCRDVPSMAGIYSLDSFSAENISKSLAGELIINTDNKTDPRTADLWESSYEPIGNRANVTVPLMKEGKLAAVLTAQSKQPRIWTEIEIEMLKLVVERTWLAVENARLLRSTQQNAAILAAMANAALDCIVMIDHNGTVVDWNPAAEQTFGYKREQAVGREMAELIIPPELREKHRMGMARFLSTGEGPVLGRRIEVEAVRADGSRFPIELSITPISTQDTPMFTGYLRDITERRRSEDDLISRQRDIERLNERLRNAMLETHHRIRNNLQMIVALTDMQIMEGRPTVPVSELQRITGQVRTLAAVHDILTAQSKREGDAQNLDVQLVIEELARLLRQSVVGRKIMTRLDRLQITARQGTSLAVVVNELVSNALKNSAGDVHIHFAVNGTHAMLKVEDEGPGFPPDFDPIKAANTGLELIHNIAVWDLSAELTFGSRPEGGGCVSIRMPVAP